MGVLMRLPRFFKGIPVAEDLRKFDLDMTWVADYLEGR